MLPRFLFGLLASTTALAHPGWGLQVDVEGNVYFTDLDHVYRAAADGGVDRWVEDVHSHALYLDEDEALIGEHSWVNEGGEFRHRYWRADASGKRSELSPAAAAASFGMASPNGGQLLPFSDNNKGVAGLASVTDGAASASALPRVGAVDGSLEQARFGIFGAAISDGAGGLLVTSGGQLRAIDARGRVTTVLGEAQGFPFDAEGSSRLLGLSLAFNGDVFVADLDERELLRVDRDTGEVIRVLGADLAWTIAGVHVSGTYVYLLEVNRFPWSSDVRVRRMDSNGRVEFVARNP
ncbi:MAG: hypothetical protein AAGE01_08065 [Pseudomonadota bacterium]